MAYGKMTSDLLRLRAEDLADLEVISSCMQDALTSVEDMAYLPRLRRFAMVSTRFRWERFREPRIEGGERIRSGLHFDSVLSARMHGIDASDKRGLLPLLALEGRALDDGNVEITFRFAAGAAVRLVAECIDCHLRDIGEGWPTPNRPDHGA